MITKKELSRLTDVSLSLGYFRPERYGRERTFTCPVHHEAKRLEDVRDTEIKTHRFSVFQPYGRLSDDPLLKRDVRAALAQHLADMDEDGTPCNDISKAVLG